MRSANALRHALFTWYLEGTLFGTRWQHKHNLRIGVLVSLASAFFNLCLGALQARLISLARSVFCNSWERVQVFKIEGLLNYPIEEE